MTTDDPLQPRHPIRVVAQRTALSTEVLRAWERRYGVVAPRRTDTGQRLYSDADVEKLRLLRQATEQGRSIGHVAQLSTGELSALVREDEEQRAQSGGRGSDAEAVRQAVEPHLRAVQEAVYALDAPRLEAALMRALVALSAESFLEEVVVPLLRMLGRGWAEGTLRVAHEHMAAAVLRRVLGFMSDTGETPGDAPLLVAATPTRQVHEFGALLAAATAAAQGWRVIYLGADLPAHEIAFAARRTGADAVALSLVYFADDAGVADELRLLRRETGESTELLIGGAAAGQYARVLEEVGARRMTGLGDLRSALRELAERVAADGARQRGGREVPRA
jgi:MerR family transcriptional regulator, light-induced transcriptional regulator